MDFLARCTEGQGAPYQRCHPRAWMKWAQSHDFSCQRSGPEGGAGVQILWPSCEEQQDNRLWAPGQPSQPNWWDRKRQNHKQENGFQDPLLLWIFQGGQTKSITCDKTNLPCYSNSESLKIQPQHLIQNHLSIQLSLGNVSTVRRKGFSDVQKVSHQENVFLPTVKWQPVVIMVPFQKHSPIFLAWNGQHVLGTDLHDIGKLSSARRALVPQCPQVLASAQGSPLRQYRNPHMAGWSVFFTEDECPSHRPNVAPLLSRNSARPCSTLGIF